MADEKKPVVDEYGYAGPWGDAKPGDVLPGISTDPVQRQKDLDAYEEVERQRDIIGDQIAEISARLGDAWDQGDEELVEKLVEEQHRLMDLQRSIK